MSESNDRDLIRRLSAKRGSRINRISSLGGGSINRVYLIDTFEEKQVIKINKSSRFPQMFEAEKQGLEELRKSGDLDVPVVLDLGEDRDLSYLLLEYKEQATPKSEFWSSFAEGLAGLHKNTSTHFGFHSSNYIGSLPQYNEAENSAADFYINQRLLPQLEMATNRGFSFKNSDSFLQNIAAQIPEEPPALIHGDLWSGNFICNAEGLPCLIDPAVGYAPREMDLAMMKLFGGFPEEVFLEYRLHFPLPPGFEQRIPLWQLYYLLVHLNIFGSSYLKQVEDILYRFS